MTFFDRAAQAIADTSLEAANRSLAEHWLSLWAGDEIPARKSLRPEKLRAFLPTVLLLDTVPGRSVTVRLAGTTFRRALDTELTGTDWIASAPPDYRETRLRIISQIARGAIGIGHRRVEMCGEDDYVCEEILLPFAADGDGPATVLVHVNWHPEHLSVVRSATQALGNPLDFAVLALH